MNLIEAKTGNKLNGIIEEIDQKELNKFKKHKNFVFDWTLEKNHQVFKIRLKESKEVLGLISLIDFPNEFRIHINIIESSKLQRGKNKTILNIPGCLIGFTCKLAFKRGYEGFVSLVSKTKLEKYYQKTYGFISLGTHMAVFEEISESLINKYFDDEEI